MKIVFVMDQFDAANNGTTVTARRMAQQLRAQGHTVTILAGGAPEEGKLCAQKHRIPFFQRLIESQGMCFAKPDPALYYEAFHDADVVHFFMPFRFCREGERYARQMGIPCVAAFHIQPENITFTLYLNRFATVNRLLYRWFYKVFYNRFDHIHCPSQMIAGQLAAQGYHAQTHVISNGVSQTFQLPETPRLTKDEDEPFRILMIGRLSREKRQDVLLRAVQLSRHADKIQLVFAGKGPCARRYRRMGRRFARPPIFQFFSQDELLRTLHQSDLYVHASDAEIEGISCLEAMACGLVPVISNSPLSATGQYALHEQSLFAAGDAADLAAKIDYWIEHPEERAEMAQRYHLSQQHNRVDFCANQMVDFYAEAIREAPLRSFETRVPKKRRRLLAPNAGKINDRILSQKPRKAALSQLFSALVAGILAPFHRLFFGLRIEGRENLAALNGAVTVCNHIHMMDCTMIKLALGLNKLWLISLPENFDIPVAGRLIKLLGAVSLGRNHREYGQLQRRLLDRLEAGDFVHYYPEGMLVPYCDHLREFHDGAFRLAVRGGKPVVPLVLCPRPGRGLRRLKKKPCLTLRVLPPVYPDPALKGRQAVAELEKLVQFSMRRALQDEKQPKAQPISFPAEYTEYYDYEQEDAANEYLWR